MTPEEKLDAYFAEISNNLDTQNFDSQGGQHLARKAMKQVSEIQQKLGVATNNGADTHVGIGSNATITALIVHSFGDLNIVVKRNSTNIALDLPYVLFAANDVESNFISTLRGSIPAGVTLVVTRGATGAIRMTYTQTAGGAIDTIDISLLSVNTTYSAFLNAMSQNYFKTKYILYTISDVTQQTQFRRLVTFGDNSALGGASSNQLSLDSRIMTWDFKSDRVNMLIPEQKITAQFAFVQLATQNTQEIGWNIFMSERKNLNILF